MARRSESNAVAAYRRHLARAAWGVLLACSSSAQSNLPGTQRFTFSGDPAAAISRAALAASDALAEKALDLFIAVYGAEASNLGLKAMATGGLFLAGGISPKILSKLKGPCFMQAFLDKGRMRHLVEAMPVHVVINEKVGLLGAARCAAVRGFRG